VVKVHLHPDHEWIPWLFDNGVPKGFWDNSDTHGRYAAWLAAELQLVEPEDWYQLTAKMVFENSGAGLLANHYNNSPQQFVEQVVKVHLHPDREWFPWQFESGVPRGFWEDSDNHGRYVAWLAAELQLVEPEDWYQLTQKLMYQNGGGGLLTAYYNSSPQQFVEQVVKVHLHPDHDWIPWQFDGGAPHGFWEDGDNHGRYAAWLAAELQLVEPEDWYQLTRKTIYSNGGVSLLNNYYNNSPQQFVEQVVKEYPVLFLHGALGWHLHPDDEWIPQ